MTTKDSLRAQLKAARSSLSEAQRAAARHAICRVVLSRCTELGLPAGTVVACYQPLRTEPGSAELLAALHAAGYQVLVPHTLPDRDLDWLAWPAGDERPLGVDAIAGARLLLVPAYAVDGEGNRLGRGGGSYDRALARVPASTPVAALLFSGELLSHIPTDPWDRPVTAAVTPTGWHELASAGRGNT